MYKSPIHIEDPSALREDELFDLIQTGCDRLPRSVADECVRRQNVMVPLLAWILQKEENWESNDDCVFWSLIHATYILADIGNERVIDSLLNAIQLAVIYNNDWITNSAPSMLVKLGEPVIEELYSIAHNDHEDWFIRSIAVEALGQLALLLEGKEQKKIFDSLASIMKSDFEDDCIQGIAASALLNANQIRYKKSLLIYASLEEQKFALHGKPMHLNIADVEEAFSDESNRKFNTFDWMKFYNEDEIIKRQKRWRQERREKSWWFRPLSPIVRWIRFRCMKKELNYLSECNKK